jgi:hypothetical protein
MHWSSFLISRIALMIILDGVSRKAVHFSIYSCCWCCCCGHCSFYSRIVVVVLVSWLCVSTSYFVFFRFPWFFSGSNCLGIPALSYDAGDHRAHSNAYISQHRWKRGMFLFFLIIIVVLLRERRDRKWACTPDLETKRIFSSCMLRQSSVCRDQNLTTVYLWRNLFVCVLCAVLCRVI